MEVKIVSPAKINLGLKIIKKSTLGKYHEVDFIMQTVSLSDVVTIKKTNGKQILVSCNKKLDCAPQENLAYKAAASFFEHSDIKNEGIEIKIEKNIPVASGLAGGSSNAAAVLVGLNEMFDSKLSGYELLKIGEQIGSDVPFCILGGTMRAIGRGTILESITPLKHCYIAITKHGTKTSTSEMYKNFGKTIFNRNSFKSAKRLLSAVEKGNFDNIVKLIFNDFEQITPEKSIEDIKSLMTEKGALAACMTGAGPSVYGIFTNKIDAENYIAAANKIFKENFLCEPINHGAQMIFSKT